VVALRFIQMQRQEMEPKSSIRAELPLREVSLSTVCLLCRQRNLCAAASAAYLEAFFPSNSDGQKGGRYTSYRWLVTGASAFFFSKTLGTINEAVKILGSKILSLSDDSRTFCDGKKEKSARSLGFWSDVWGALRRCADSCVLMGDAVSWW
jgi:hypothetical protein